MKKNAFTLAEVLITLTIIGIIAAMTMPTLIANHQEQVTVTKLKKVYSVLEQAYTQIIYEYGTPDEWGMSNGRTNANAKLLAEKFKPYLKITGEENDSADYRYYLSDGTIVRFDWLSPDCSSIVGTGKLSQRCAAIDVAIKHRLASSSDWSGCWNKTCFSFEVTKESIIPRGTRESTGGLGSTGGAAAWIIYNGNMDYLRCYGELSWGGKTKCD